VQEREKLEQRQGLQVPHQGLQQGIAHQAEIAAQQGRSYLPKDRLERGVSHREGEHAHRDLRSGLGVDQEDRRGGSLPGSARGRADAEGVRHVNESRFGDDHLGLEAAREPPALFGRGCGHDLLAVTRKTPDQVLPASLHAVQHQDRAPHH
jgi:hypothetical protein